MMTAKTTKAAVTTNNNRQEKPDFESIRSHPDYITLTRKNQVLSFRDVQQPTESPEHLLTTF